MPQPQPAALTFDTVKRIALGLPEVTESTSYGTAALKVRDKLMIRRKEDSETIVLRTSWEERERLMVVYPDAFYITEHYRNYPMVLVRLSGVAPSILEQVIKDAWTLTAPKSVLKRLAQP